MKVLLALAALSVATAASAEAPGPTPANWQSLVDGYLQAHLRDPYTAVKHVTRQPRWTSFKTDAWSAAAGWAVCYTINAKNAYGGYIGERPYLFVFTDSGVSDAFTTGERESSLNQGIIDRECSQGAPPLAAGPNPKVPL